MKVHEMEYYHPECIGLNITEEYAESLSSFKCVICTDNGIDSPLYIEARNRCAPSMTAGTGSW